MSRDSTFIPFRQPEAIDDPLTEVAREGAQRKYGPGPDFGGRLASGSGAGSPQPSHSPSLAPTGLLVSASHRLRGKVLLIAAAFV